MKLLQVTVLGLGAIAAAGCASSVKDEPVEVKPVTGAAKEMLESVAETGHLGSTSMEIRNELDKMKAAGDAKAGEVLDEMSKLETMSDPAQIKKKAKELADKL